MNSSVVRALVILQAAILGIVISISRSGTITALGVPGQQPPAITRAFIRPAVENSAPAEYPGLHNVVAFHDRLISGSAPDGDSGFESLMAMGVKTIISVDGDVPDVERARALGLKYIHLPIEYNGIEHDRKLQLVRAASDALKVAPAYIHCHHGKHRSACVAAVICVSLGWATPQTMIDRMKVAGTSPSYPGLFRCVADARMIQADVIDSVPDNFPSVSRPAGLVKTMVEIDRVHDHLTAIRDAGWIVPQNHPDLVPAAQAGRLADLFRLVQSDEHTSDQGAEFAEFLADAQTAAGHLEDLIVADRADAVELARQFKALNNACNDCHAVYRNR